MDILLTSYRLIIDNSCLLSLDRSSFVGSFKCVQIKHHSYLLETEVMSAGCEIAMCFGFVMPYKETKQKYNKAFKNVHLAKNKSTSLHK